MKYVRSNGNPGNLLRKPVRMERFQSEIFAAPPAVNFVQIARKELRPRLNDLPLDKTDADLSIVLQFSPHFTMMKTAKGREGPGEA